MKKFNIDVFLNGKVTFEVFADNKEQAKTMVNDVIENSSLKELRQKEKSTIETEIKFEKEKEQVR